LSFNGNTAHGDTAAVIHAYNKLNSGIHLPSNHQRGGRRITLTIGDIVPLYDSNWNPPADLQALAREHWIGDQTSLRLSVHQRGHGRGIYVGEGSAGAEVGSTL